jgi:prevent-host-death family protein
MKQVGVYDAKTHLPRLLDAVERGETITITRHGRPVARLVPVKPNRRSVEEAIEELREFGRRHPLGDLKIRDLIEEGRKY